MKVLLQNIVAWVSVLFSDRVERIEIRERAAEKLFARAAALDKKVKLDALDVMKEIEKASPADYLREKLKIVSPRLLLSEKDLPAVLEDIAPGVEESSFLSHMHDIHKKKYLNILLDVLIREQILFSMKEAKTLEEINGGRMTINGLELIREEVERLASLYTTKHQREKVEFDEYAVV